MKQFAVLFLLTYYTFGSICLPKGDFSLLVDLPKMFQECEKTEHHGMNIFEFLTEHLVDIGGVCDAHDNDDEQRPHKPFHFSHQAQLMIVSLPPSLALEIVLQNRFFTTVLDKRLTFSHQSFILSSFSCNIFRPPIF